THPGGGGPGGRRGRAALAALAERLATRRRRHDNGAPAPGLIASPDDRESLRDGLRRPAPLFNALGLAAALLEQAQVVGDVLVVGVLALGGDELLARADIVAAQHVGIALVVEDRRRRTRDADCLLVGAIGEIETAQPVIGRSKTEPGFGVVRMQ